MCETSYSTTLPPQHMVLLAHDYTQTHPNWQVLSAYIIMHICIHTVIKDRHTTTHFASTRKDNSTPLPPTPKDIREFPSSTTLGWHDIMQHPMNYTINWCTSLWAISTSEERIRWVGGHLLEWWQYTQQVWCKVETAAKVQLHCHCRWQEIKSGIPPT